MIIHGWEFGKIKLKLKNFILRIKIIKYKAEETGAVISCKSGTFLWGWGADGSKENLEVVHQMGFNVVTNSFYSSYCQFDK